MTTDRRDGWLSWLKAAVVRRASDILLGSLSLAAGTVAIANSDGRVFERWAHLDSSFFPTVIGGLLQVVGILLLARGIFSRRGPLAPWNFRGLAITVAAVVAARLAVTMWEQPVLPEWWMARPWWKWGLPI